MLAAAACLLLAALGPAPQSPPPASSIEARIIASFQHDQEVSERYLHTEDTVNTKDGRRWQDHRRIWYVHGRPVSNDQQAQQAALRPPPPAGMIEFAGHAYPFARLAHDYLYTPVATRPWQGRATWVYAARPDPAVAARSREEEILLHSHAEVWVDADELHVVRIQVHLTSPVRYILGLVATVRQANLDLLMERQADGSWLPASTHFSLQATVLLFDSLRRGQDRAYSGWQPTQAPN